MVKKVHVYNASLSVRKTSPDQSDCTKLNLDTGRSSGPDGNVRNQGLLLWCIYICCHLYVAFVKL